MSTRLVESRFATDVYTGRAIFLPTITLALAGSRITGPGLLEA